MSQVNVNTIKDTSGGSNAVLYGVASPTGSMGFRNRIINGDMRIDQRNAGASVTVNASNAPYCPDRWNSRIQQASGAMTAQQSSVAPAGFNSSLLFTVTNTTAPAAGNRVHVRQGVEGFNVADLGWGTANAQAATLSFWVRSSVTGTYGVGFINQGENRSYVGTYTVNSANIWEYKTITVPGDTSGTWATDANNGVRLTFDLGSGTSFNATANTWVSQEACRTSGCVNFQQNAGATFYITGVQLEAGSVATPFERRPYGTELALCQRYCFVSGNLNYYQYAVGQVTNTTTAYFIFNMPVTMRAAPSYTVTNVTNFTINDTAGPVLASSSSLDVASVNTVGATWVGSGFTSGRAARLYQSGASASQITFSAEL